MKRLFFLIFVLSAFSCGMNAQQSKADRFYLEGMRLIDLGNPTAAFQMFSHCLELNPKMASAKFQLSMLQQYLRNDSVASQLLVEAVEDAPDNYWYKQALVDYYARHNKTDEAVTVLEQMSVQFPTDENVLLMLEEMYKQKQDYANVVKILDRLELKEGKTEALSMEKYRIFVQMNDRDRAFREIQSLVDEYPNDLRYEVLMGDLYFNNDESDKAFEIYQDVQAKDSSNINLMVSLLNYYSKTNQDSLYQKLIESISTNPRLDNETRLRFLNSLVMQNLTEKKDSTQLLGIFDRVMKMPQEDTQIAELYARYMLTINMPAEKVRPVLLQMQTIDPECDLARNQLLQYAIDDNDTLGIIRLCKPAVDYSSDNPIYYYYLGIAYFQADSTRQAIDTFRKGISKVSPQKDVQILANIYALLGDCYHRQGDIRHAYEVYDSCLLYRPDDALVLNNYAYYLSLEGKRLDKAEEMSRRTLEKEPENYTYIDTYAWILFQQKKYAEAKVYIDSALVIIGDGVNADDSTIYEHAGDIYAKMGFMDKAVDYWQISSDLGNKSAVLVKKLKKQKYYAY